MIKRIILITLTVLVAIQVQALEVENTAGHLSSKVTNYSIADLTVKGTMDANDFYFIVEKLTKLTTVDLSQVEVLACQTGKMHYWLRDFEAALLPVGAFAGMDLTSVKLPSGLKTIGEGAFTGCTKLTSITLPSTLTAIGDYAFAGCTALRSITLPASVETVGDGAFMRCKALTSLSVASSSKLRSIGNAAMLECASLKTVSLGTGVQEIGDRAFAGTGITRLNLNSSNKLTTMGKWVMVQTPVQDAQLPSSLTQLGDGAFLYDTNLTTVKLGNHLAQLDNYTFAGTSLNGDLDLTGVTSLGDYALYNVSTMSVVELPSTVTWIGAYAMAGMTGMTSMVSNAVKVPSLGENVWAGVDQPNIPLTVPVAAINSYKAAEQWKEFKFAKTWTKGDVNADGEVNIADINALVDIILGNPADSDTMMRADVNGDGEVNIADVNALVDMILNPSLMLSLRVDTDDALRLDEVSMQPGEQRTLDILLDNAENYSALQCDITLPQGLSLVDVKAGKDQVVKSDDIDALTSRVALYSMSKQPFTSNRVLTITVLADAALATESEIQLTHVVLADDDNVGWHVANYASRVTNSTGVEDLTADADNVWIEGRTLCIETRNAGTALITAINGSARDIAVEQGVNRHELEPGFYVVTLNARSYKVAIK